MHRTHPIYGNYYITKDIWPKIKLLISGTQYYILHSIKNYIMSNITFRKPLEKDYKSTSYHFHEVVASAKELTDLLGEPNIEPDEKVQYEWSGVLEIEGKSIFFTVYDYKQYSKIPKKSQYPHWHIGGISAEDTKIVREQINQKIAYTKKP